MSSLPETPLDRAYNRMLNAAEERCAVIADPKRPDQPLVYITSAFTEHTGYAVEDAVGRNCRFLQGPDTDPADVAAIRQAIDEWRSLTVDILNYRKDGSPFWNRLRLRPVFRGGTLDVYVGAQNPIPECDVDRRRQFDLPAVDRPAPIARARPAGLARRA